jgi:SHS2 domain-containing protein
MNYEILDHTADICVRVYGESFDDLLRNAARAMMDIITDREKVNPSQEIKIKAQGETKEELLVHWLDEILFIHQVKKMVLRDFEVHLVSETEVRGKAFGESIDAERHEIGLDIKAITYHNLKIEPSDDRLKVDIVFDI